MIPTKKFPFVFHLLSVFPSVFLPSGNCETIADAKAFFGKVNGESELMRTSGTRKIAGVYPHLTTYSQSREDGRFFKDGHQECGIGGIIPWAGKLWMITYAPHKPRGSDHKLYSIDKNMTMTIHAESVGGTPAARMVHEESNQLFRLP